MFGSGLANTRPAPRKQFKTKKYFKDNKLSGLYQEFDPYTDELREEGNFRDGVETGKWRVIDEDGDEIHYEYSMVRVGARCMDGTSSSATGRGACSWHGGVAEWLYGAQKNQVGGTGKYMPLQQRVQALRDKAKGKFKINKFGLELEEEILKLLFRQAEKNEKMTKELFAVKEELESANEELDELHEELKKQKEKTKEKEKEKEKAKEEKKPIIVNNFIQNKNEKSAADSKVVSKDKLEPAKPSPTKPNTDKDEKKTSKKQEEQPEKKQPEKKESDKKEPQKKQPQKKQAEKKEPSKLPNPYEQDDPDWQDYEDSEEQQEEEETADQQYSLIHELLARMNLK